MTATVPYGRELQRSYYDTAYRYLADEVLEQAMSHCELVLAVARVDAEIEHPTPYLDTVEAEWAACYDILARRQRNGYAISRHGKFPKETIDAIKQRVDLPAVIGQTVPLNRGKGCCPFHEDRDPSFIVKPDHYFCFGCRQYGDIIDWTQHVHQLTFVEAVHHLAKLTGTTL